MQKPLPVTAGVLQFFHERHPERSSMRKLHKRGSRFEMIADKVVTVKKKAGA